jgi:hypothetical protein
MRTNRISGSWLIGAAIGIAGAGPAAAIDLLPAGSEFVVSANVIPRQLNDDVPTTTPRADVDESAHFYRFAVQWPSDKPLIGSSKKAYYGVVKMKSVGRVEDEYVESVDEVALIYGHRYYLFEEHRGLNLGWYGGVSSWKAKGYDYDGTTRYAGYSESGVSAIVAAELSYDLRIPVAGTHLWVNPAIAFSLDKDYGEFKFWPSIEIGLVFK